MDPRFFPLIYRAWAINQREKTRIRNLQYGPRKRGQQDIYYISEVNRRAGKETSQSEAEGSTAIKNAVPKSQKLNLLGC